MNSLQEQIRVLDNLPGVYQFYDSNGSLLYVGKAKKLKHRVSSYFNKKKYVNGKTKVMVSKVTQVKTIHLDSEIDALLLENKLIKKYQPRYNVQLKDDKTYPWICIKDEMFPRIFYTRKKVKNGSLYFGPYPSVKVVKAVIEMAKSCFEIRSCNHVLNEEKISSGEFNTSVDYYIGNCKGCCQGEISQEVYDERIQHVKSALNGEFAKVLKGLKKTMDHHAKSYEFEAAENIKVKIKQLENFQFKSTVVDTNINYLGVMNLTRDFNTAYINSMLIMHGTIIKSKTTTVQANMGEDESQILSYVLGDNLSGIFSEIKELVLPQPLAIDTTFKIHIPQRGDKRNLLLLSKKNATAKKTESLKAEHLKDPESKTKHVLSQLKLDLRLKEIPIHMECFDNSNFQGNYPVASCVVFKNAKPAKKEYRRFNIKTVEGPNDFASMEEVIYRRYQRMINEKEDLPQLIVVDGGKGQLSSALKSLKSLNIHKKVGIIGIAKKLEEIYFPQDQLPLYLDKKSTSLKVIQHMRNEAHRFGINHHRNKRIKGTIQTELSTIKGIGEKTALQLLKKFGDVKSIKNKSEKELANCIGKLKAKLIYRHFNL